jgi:hypothetical protein
VTLRSPSSGGHFGIFLCAGPAKRGPQRQIRSLIRGHCFSSSVWSRSTESGNKTGRGTGVAGMEVDSAIAERFRRGNKNPSRSAKERKGGAVGQSIRCNSIQSPTGGGLGKGFFRPHTQPIRHQLFRRRPMRKFQDSIKALEADIEHANAL